MFTAKGFMFTLKKHVLHALYLENKSSNLTLIPRQNNLTFTGAFSQCFFLCMLALRGHIVLFCDFHFLYTVVMSDINAKHGQTSKT